MSQPKGKDNVVLVTGGCGFLGFHIVEALLQERSISAIHVFSRNPTTNRLPGVIYHAGSLTSDKDVEAVLTEVRPNVVFHVASPVFSGNTNNAKVYHDINVEGTKILLRHAEKTKETSSFIYTSSSGVAQGPFHSITEKQPLLHATSRTSFDYYGTTKAIADELVLNANDPQELQTCSLRVTVMYGERDKQLIPGTLKVMEDKQHTIQIGDNSQLMDFLSVTNAARAHVLAYRALMNPETASKVAGGAFFITDGKPMPFWTFSRKVWTAAGDKTPPEKITIVPAWLVIGMAIALEWIYFVFTFGQRTPEFFKSYTMRYVTEERTFSIEKARKLLGYKPVDEIDEGIRDAVAWYLKEKNQKAD